MSERTLSCKLQNQLGGLDKLLGALTHRGFLPKHMHCEGQGDLMSVRIIFDCEDDHTFYKLLKYVDKQIMVVDVQPRPNFSVSEALAIMNS